MTNKSNQTVPEDIVKKIQKMLRLANHAKSKGSAEAEVAMNKVHAFLKQYQLDLADIDVDADDSRGKVSIDLVQEPVFEDRKKLHVYICHIGRALANLFDCQQVVQQGTRTEPSRIFFVGTKLDIVATRQLFDYVVKRMMREGYRIRKDSFEYNVMDHAGKMAWTQTFYISFAARLAERVNEIKRKEEQELEHEKLEAEQGECTTLARRWDAIKLAKKTALTHYMNQSHFKQIEVKGQRRLNSHDAAQAGKTAANRIDLSKTRKLG